MLAHHVLLVIGISRCSPSANRVFIIFSEAFKSVTLFDRLIAAGGTLPEAWRATADGAIFSSDMTEAAVVIELLWQKKKARRAQNELCICLTRCAMCNNIVFFFESWRSEYYTSCCS